MAPVGFTVDPCCCLIIERKQMERYNVTVPKILSVNLAITAILSTWMLQLGNQENYAIAVSLFSIPVILGGLIVTDFFKRFSLSDSICNVLIIFILIVLKIVIRLDLNINTSSLSLISRIKIMS